MFLIYSVLCCVVILQDNPDQGVLYLVRGLLNVIQDYTWDSNSDAKARVYITVLCLLSAASQDYYIYHIDQGKLFYI